jgi:hypothetical protein
VELVITGDLLSQDAADLILEDGKVAHEIEQPSLLPQCLNHNLKFWHRLRGERFPSFSSSPAQDEADDLNGH